METYIKRHDTAQFLEIHILLLSFHNITSTSHILLSYVKRQQI